MRAKNPHGRAPQCICSAGPNFGAQYVRGRVVDVEMHGTVYDSHFRCSHMKNDYNSVNDGEYA